MNGGIELSLIDVELEPGVEVPQRLSSTMIDFGAVGIDEIYQNIKYIILTPYFSVVLDREFGFDYTLVDKPEPVARLMIDQEITMKIALYEPRAFFKETRYDEFEQEGKVRPIVIAGLLVTT